MSGGLDLSTLRMTHSTLAVRAATGLMGVTDNLDSLSLSDCEDSERDAEDKPSDAGLIVLNMDVWKGVVLQSACGKEWLQRVKRAA